MQKKYKSFYPVGISVKKDVRDKLTELNLAGVTNVQILKLGIKKAYEILEENEESNF